MFKWLLLAWGIIAVFSLAAREADGHFNGSFWLGGNQLRLGDWAGPELEVVSHPVGDEAFGSLEIKVRAVDSHSKIQHFEFSLFSHTPNDPNSDWVKPFQSISCADGECDSLDEEGEIFLALDKNDNPNHKLCAGDESWCLDKPLPDGAYYLVARAYDSSRTVNDAGNKSEDLTYSFTKKSSNVICNLSTINVRAGQTIFFPNVHCEGEPELTEIKWDLNDQDGVDFSNPDLVGDGPSWGGYKDPGTYIVTVQATNEEGKIREQSFIVNVENPDFSLNDLVINEFVANPSGDDKALKPEGEWVEIYNKLGAGVDLLGFVLYDSYDNHDLPITKENCEGDSTLIPARSYKVVYRSGDPDFSLNNSGAEKARLFDGFIENQAMLLDEVEYVGGASEGNSLARNPDGEGDFKEAEPTKGKRND